MILISQKDIFLIPQLGEGWSHNFEKNWGHFGSVEKPLHGFYCSHFTEDCWKCLWSAWKGQAGALMSIWEPLVWRFRPLEAPPLSRSSLSSFLPSEIQTHRGTLRSSREKHAMYRKRISDAYEGHLSSKDRIPHSARGEGVRVGAGASFPPPHRPSLL